MSDWEEVKRLAADLQKAQLSSTLQRLSERNCVEIVTHLIKHKYLDVIFSNDGREYITPEYLVKEISAELYVHGGRINMTELSKILRIDLNQIINYSKDIIKRKDVHLVLNQLIDDTYITRIAGEINEKLSVNGRISVNELTMQYDLPAEFLQKFVFTKHIASGVIRGKQDANDINVYYTEAFAARTKAKIRGALAALTKPTPTAVILAQCNLQESTFFLMFDQIASLVAGSFSNRLSTGQYIPYIYSKSQSEWLHNFYRQNHYIEFDALTRLGIIDPKTYIKRQFPNENLVTLSTCAMSQLLIDQVDAAVEECLASHTCLDIQTVLPSLLNEKDIEIVLEQVINESRKRLCLVLGYCILSTAYLDALSTPCECLCEERAKLAVEAGTYQQFQAEKQLLQRQIGDINDIDTKSGKRDKRRNKKTGGKSGGGTQGRETKTKVTKNKYYQSNKPTVDSDEEVSVKKSNVLELITVDDISNLIEAQLEEDGISELLNEISSYLQIELNTKALKIASDLHANAEQNKASIRRQNHAAAQDRINALLTDLRLFDKGAKSTFHNDELNQLIKYLLKTQGNELVNEIVYYSACELELNVNNLTVNLNPEQRNKLINEMPSDSRLLLQNLVKQLNTNVDELLKSAEKAVSNVCGMIVKRIDKKRDRALIINHQFSLEKQMMESNDPPMVLHLAVLILFSILTQHMLHASGRHVSAIIQSLKTQLPPEHSEILVNYYDLVTQYLTNTSSNDKELILNELNNKMSALKALPFGFLRPNKRLYDYVEQ